MSDRSRPVALLRIAHDGIDGTGEVETTVGDFETHRSAAEPAWLRGEVVSGESPVSFVLDGTRLEIDTWPMIPTYLEIEGDSHDDVVRVAKLLGHDEAQLTGENSVKVYARYGIDLLAIPDLRFTNRLNLHARDWDGLPQHFLYLRSDPHQHGSFRPGGQAIPLP